MRYKIQSHCPLLLCFWILPTELIDWAVLYDPPSHQMVGTDPFDQFVVTQPFCYNILRQANERRGNFHCVVLSHRLWAEGLAPVNRSAPVHNDPVCHAPPANCETCLHSAGLKVASLFMYSWEQHDLLRHHCT
jgi:hypothetical protein